MKQTRHQRSHGTKWFIFIFTGLLFFAGTAVVLATFSVTPTLETTNDDPSEQVRYDDPSIWVHPTDPALSLLIAANKRNALFVFDMNGAEVQDVREPSGNNSYNNVDVRYRFPLNGELIDIAVATQRNTNSLEIYKIDATTRQLVDVGDKVTNDALINYEPYGIGLYHDPDTDRFYAFVTDNGGNHDVRQYELLATTDGQIKLVLQRTLNNINGLTEGVVADDINGVVYIAEEDSGIFRYDASPTASLTRTTVALIGDNGLTADIEGLAIYYAIPDNCNGKSGYLLASSQGNHTFHVFEREAGNAYLGNFSVDDDLINGVDGLSSTDGIDVTNLSLGPNFPNGFFAGHDDVDGTNSFENVKMVDWQDIATGISAVEAEQLCVDTSWHPRIVPPKASGSVAASSDKVALNWTDFNLTSCYAIHRSTSPYFTPDATTLYDATLTQATMLPYVDPDLTVLGNTAVHHFYSVEARNCDASLPQASNIVGEFQFNIVAGS